jgi:hypothetical protein
MAEISRRTLLSRTVLLAGLAAGAGVGLTKRVRHKVAVPPPAPPAALTDALAAQQRLLAGYDAMGFHYGWPAIPGLRSDVAAHGDALRALLEHYPGWRLARARSSAAAVPTKSATGSGVDGSAAPSATGSVKPSATGSAAPSATGSVKPTSIDQLATATAANARSLTKASLTWPADEQHAVEVVPVLASIAACLASHAQVLS